MGVYRLTPEAGLMTEWDRKGFNKCICASFTAKSRVPRISVNPRCSCLARSLAFLPGERY
jgi:hypothetical protein